MLVNVKISDNFYSDITHGCPLKQSQYDVCTEIEIYYNELVRGTVEAEESQDLQLTN